MLLDEPRRYHLEKEWAQLRAFDVADFTERTVGLHPTNTIPLKYRTQPCRDLPTERRITMQDGVTDAAVSTQCWRAPYYNSGQRMGNRPEPQS
jgi:hypothetical protein